MQGRTLGCNMLELEFADVTLIVEAQYRIEIDSMGPPFVSAGRGSR